MIVEQQVDTLVASVDELKSAVVTKKATLDASVVDAQSATGQAHAAKGNALSARDQAGAFKDAAYTAAQSAASAVAYQDLTARTASKPVTAVDVFVYDTSKDSDGGAWRHRCAGMSWYREPLNTETRGTRREFPALAVIVANANNVTIYDGDDPTLPMWAIYQQANTLTEGRQWFHNVFTVTGLSAKNGKVCFGSEGGNSRNTTLGLHFIDFGADIVGRYSSLASRGGFGLNASSGSKPTDLSSLFDVAIADVAVSDVAMTVLPNAPSDLATGLPVPTIAVATAGGVSVIHDDDTLYNSAKTAACIDFTIDAVGRLRAVFTDGDMLVYDVAVITGDGFTGTIFNAATVPALRGAPTSAAARALGSTNALSLLSAGDNMVAYAASSFASGWLPGSTKGAFLADTSGTDLVGDGALTVPDRSVANKPLLVVGTITRAPVATGVDLVAYSGFSETNCLEGSDATYVDTLYALGWQQNNGVWEFKHGVVSAAPIDGLTITDTTLKIAGTKPKALVRVTATTPTAAQLAKIEADERFLFQENAACTLYGASDAVAAIAHDPDTGLLHVGTAAGRSVFQGLRRVANTTVPVTTAIAAAGGMVIIQ
ncbi:MAG: hypothetical protein LC676_08760 [Loktanella sp.]|nr:hypothetical protein [Loktanella sp.]